MARMARLVFAGVPHHVTQRGNGRAQTFFDDADYGAYRDLLAEHAAAAGVAVWSWVLMPNHVHLILTPREPADLSRAMAAVHRAYAGRVHGRLKRTGHFWQGRFGCVAMYGDHLDAALRYVALNPVRAGLVRRAIDWKWASTRRLCGLTPDDGVTAADAVLDIYPDYADMIAAGEDAERFARLRRAESIGRPVGADAWLKQLEAQSGRTLRPAKGGRKPKSAAHESEISALSP